MTSLINLTSSQVPMISSPAINGNVNQNPVLKNASILIIDDNESNIQVLGGLLKKHDCNVLTANDADKGLKIAEKKIPDLILLDVLMPATNGFETYTLLKQNEITCSIPVIFITASDDPRDLQKGFDLGAVDYISKPFNPVELIARVTRHLKLDSEKKQAKVLFNSQYHSFVTLDKNFRIVNFNTKTEREYLLNKKCLEEGGYFLDFIDKADQDFMRRGLEKVFKGKTIEFEKNYIMDGEQKWFHYVVEPIRERTGEISLCVVSGTNVTSKKEAELEDANFLQKINDIYSESQQSLSYAGYIQKAIFPDNLEASGRFKDSFVLFKSKEKVSGDFYWTYDLGEKSLLILGDCTGHGVPGAMLTTISVVLLERVVKYQKVYSPEKILFELNANIVNILRQNNGGVKDGLEMAICLFDHKKKVMEFAGAKRSVVIVEKANLKEIKGDRQEIGGVGTKKFAKQKILLEEGASVYIYSDGITDQLGGEKNKKFKKNKLQQMILAVHNEPMKHQKIAFNEAITKWIGNEEQTDDILLVGVKI
jgi:PAS domain S-box-containing protein